MSDSDLLRQFAAHDSQGAFAELVRRRIDLVYSAALRQLAGDAHRAQDVTQEVFVALACKARTLASHPDLLGWLFTSTHFAAVQAIRAEQRRKQRERVSQLMHETPDLGRTDPEWERVRPLLDGALHELPARDRQVILLRFFDGKPFAAIGEKLGLSENAAQKSAERALEKL
jgi:RNA polymerase sigma factor (sigma-70 family)